MQKNLSIVLLLLLLVSGSIYLFSGRSKTTMNEAETRFSVKDTAGIQKIEITEYSGDKKESEIRLEKSGLNWTVNQQYTAMPEQVEQLLDVLFALQVREPVDSRARSTVLKYLKERRREVSVYRNGDLTPHRFVIGSSTPDQSGTLALLANAENPYVIEVPGSPGYLAPRFPVDLKSWVENTLFQFSPNDLASVEVIYAGADSSWKITRSANGAVAWEHREKLDEVLARQYFAQFSKVNAQSFVTQEMPKGIDSLRTLRNPDRILRITSLDGRRVSLNLYQRPENTASYWGWLDGKNQLAIVQSYVLDKYLPTRKQFIAKK